jgi:TusA-related sulfurtransferase
LDNHGSDCAAGFVRLLEMKEALAPGETQAILSTDITSQHEISPWCTTYRRRLETRFSEDFASVWDIFLTLTIK